jgi:hypothetical protein
VASSAAKAGEEIVLEPDALLVLEASGLKACVSSIRPYDQAEGEISMRPPLRRAIAWGWISDDRWALAVGSDLIYDANGADRLGEAALRWRDGRRADVQLSAEAGARGSWTVPCDQVFPFAPLDVRIVRPDESGAGRLELCLRRIVEADTDGHGEQHPWGRVIFYGRDVFYLREQLAAGEPVMHFDSVPTGSRLLLAALDEATHAYGRLVFVHDGSPRALELRPAFEIVGRLVSDATSAPIAMTDVEWHFREGKEDLWSWQGYSHSLALAPDGGFASRGPSNPLTSEAAPLDPPSHLVLHVEAPGFEPLERTFDTAGATRFDCGEIRLAPVHGEIVLAPGHGLSAKAVRWEGLMASSAPDIWWNVRDAAPTPEGGLAIFLARSDEHPDLLRTFAADLAWPSAPAQRILILVLLEDGDEPWAFERGSDGTYSAVPRVQHEIQAECRALPAEGRDWVIGWQWHELWGVTATVPSSKLGQHLALHFSTPAEGATLYWSSQGGPPRSGKERGGTIPVNALTETLVLQ